MSSIDGAVRGSRRMMTMALLAVLPSLDVQAQTNEPALPAKAADKPAKPAAKATPAKSKDLQAVTVVARGSTRQIQSIGADTVKQSVPGTSPIKLLNGLPGVNFQSSDPFGAYEWSTQINLHGFDQSRLGFTLDGIPLGNMSYGTTTGLQETRAITAENLASTQIAQGAGALGTAANTNLGGTIQFYSADPDLKPGLRINQMIGSDASKRSFVRADTGDLDGFSAYASYMHSDSDKWKGYGSQKTRQINAKAVYQWGDGNRISAFADISQHKEYDTQDLSLISAKAMGYHFDYLQPNWNEALQMANAYAKSGQLSGVQHGYPAALSALPESYDWLDSTYYAGGGLRQDHLYGLSGAFNLAEDLSLNLTTYYHNDRGEGQWVTPYQSSPASGLPLSMRTTDYRLRRYGATGSLQYTIGHNDLEAGFWVENATNNTERNYFNLYGPYTSLFDFYNAATPFLRGFSQLYAFDTRMGYLQDTLHFLDDRLTLSFGNKFLHVTSNSTSQAPTDAYAAGRLNATKGLLPQAGADYRIDDHQDVYASYTKNMAAYGALPFNESQLSFDASKGNLRPETSQTYELGYRFESRQFEASADLYYTRFANRLLSASSCMSAVQTCASILSNVGSVKSRGVDLTAVWKPLRGLRWMNTASFNQSRYEDNYQDDSSSVADANGIVHVRGAQTVDTPKWMYSSQADYQIAHWDFELDGKYTGKRYITYTDDASVPSYWLFNMSIQYDLGRLLPDVEDISLGFNIYNLGDKRYFSSVGTNGYYAGGAEGRENQTLQVGAPRQFFFNVNVKI